MTFRFDLRKPLATLALMTITTSTVIGCSSDPTTTSLDESSIGEATASSPQPYAGLQDRPIKAIGPDRVDDLLAGRGAGYALAAELNSYPGPTHILQLAEPLELSNDQRSKVDEIFKTMNADARRIGDVFVSLEADLDQLFREETINQTALVDLTTRISTAEGQLRAIHLSAHLTMKEILTETQIAEYDRLRGYSDAVDGSEGGQHDGHSEGMTHS
ncbi:MAG: hypothetical protein O3C10_08190 [Chloroflexi bacterium]|nr:hypothetical protein [Chloroflexota bacterium]